MEKVSNTYLYSESRPVPDGAWSAPANDDIAPGRGAGSVGDRVDLGSATDYANLRRHIARGRGLQARCMTAYAVGAVRAVRRLVRAAASRLRRWRAKDMTRRALSRLDDHVLRDIGISRERIPYVLDARLVGGRIPVRHPAVVVCTERRRRARVPCANDDGPPARAA